MYLCIAKLNNICGLCTFIFLSVFLQQIVWKKYFGINLISTLLFVQCEEYFQHTLPTLQRTMSACTKNVVAFFCKIAIWSRNNLRTNIVLSSAFSQRFTGNWLCNLSYTISRKQILYFFINGPQSFYYIPWSLILLLLDMSIKRPKFLLIASVHSSRFHILDWLFPFIQNFAINPLLIMVSYLYLISSYFNFWNYLNENSTRYFDMNFLFRILLLQWPVFWP